jgi:hypothetical protein
MRHVVARSVTLGLSLVVLALVSGCKKVDVQPIGAEEPAVAAAQQLPEGTNILAALKSKDYEAAVAGLAKLRDVASQGELAPPYLTLKLYVKGQLMDLAPTDPKANEALMALRSLTEGR